MESINKYQVKIITGQYQTAPTEQKEMIQCLLGENTEYNYEIYFHWYNVIHELGHVIMIFNASSRPHPAEEEQLVNDFAYAYWQYYGEQEKLKELCSIVDNTIQKFTVPTQNDISYMDYAKSKWGQPELNTFNNYGWFQFSSVQSAISEALSLEQALKNMCTQKILPQKTETLEYKICDKTAVQVVDDATRILKEWGVILPQNVEVVFNDDVNCHMCQVKKSDE